MGWGAHDLCTYTTWVHIRGIDYDYGLHLYTRKGVVLVVRLLVHHSCQKKIKGKGLHIKDFPFQIGHVTKEEGKNKCKKVGDVQVQKVDMVGKSRGGGRH